MLKMKMVMRLMSFLFFWLPFALAASSYKPSEHYTDQASDTELARISLRFYPGPTIDEYSTVLVGDAVDLLDKIDLSKKTVLYISGWTESPSSESVEAIVGAYLKRQDHNILIVDYRDIAAKDWDYCARSANGVGYTLAAALNQLVARGLDSTTLHIVGHSLGAQISGYIGRYANFTLPRITGLDAAGPSFTIRDDHLSSSDASFVDLIHTNPGFLGIEYSAGHVDFRPNGVSSVQPGCENKSSVDAAACSHARSWAYYVESLLNEKAFLAVACDSYSSFKQGSCISGTTVYMGYATPIATRGDFGLQTNSQSPYGKGAEGITYKK